jgi:hypothetical protein
MGVGIMTETLYNGFYKLPVHDRERRSRLTVLNKQRYKQTCPKGLKHSLPPLNVFINPFNIFLGGRT